jgi:DNA-binding FadR family transcriptional regulator
MISPSGEVRRVADAILAKILDGTYPFGLRLPSEAALSDELGCGRSTVREALRHLADLGIVRSRRGSGAHVLDFRREGTPALLPAYLRAGRFEAPPATLARELLRLRTVMASEAVRLAARYAEPPALAEARTALERAPELENDPAAHALNELELYRALVAASRMWPAAWLVNALWAPLREVNAQYAMAMGPVRSDWQPTMVELLGLIEKKDERGATALVRGWFETVDSQLVGLIEAALELARAAGEPRRT